MVALEQGIRLEWIFIDGLGDRYRANCIICDDCCLIF